MKNAITTLVLLISLIGFGQNNEIINDLNGSINTGNNDLLLEKVNIKVTVNSVSDINSTFSIDDIRDIIENANSGENVAFSIVCRSKGKSNISYDVKGNTSNKEKFLKDIFVVREKAINYFNNRN